MRNKFNVSILLLVVFVGLFAISVVAQETDVIENHSTVSDVVGSDFVESSDVVGSDEVEVLEEDEVGDALPELETDLEEIEETGVDESE